MVQGQGWSGDVLAGGKYRAFLEVDIVHLEPVARRLISRSKRSSQTYSQNHWRAYLQFVIDTLDDGCVWSPGAIVILAVQPHISDTEVAIYATVRYRQANATAAVWALFHPESWGLGRSEQSQGREPRTWFHGTRPPIVDEVGAEDG